MSRPDDEASPEPVVIVVNGHPTDEELAALLAVLASRSAARTPSTVGSTSQWAAYWRGLQTSIRPGPGAWRQSARTR